MLSDDSDDENTRSLQPKGQDSQGLAWMSKQRVEDVMQKFQPIKVPAGKLERIFLYFKKYPKEFNKSQAELNDNNKTSLYSSLNKHNKNPPTGIILFFL